MLQGEHTNWLSIHALWNVETRLIDTSIDSYSCHWGCCSSGWLWVPAASDVNGHEHCRSKAFLLRGGQSAVKKTKKIAKWHKQKSITGYQCSVQSTCVILGTLNPDNPHTFMALSISMESQAGSGGSWEICNGFHPSVSSILMLTLCTDAVPVLRPSTCWLEEQSMMSHCYRSLTI